MNGLLQHFELSFDSIRPPSVISVSTSMPASDTYTIEAGIGTVSGRAIYALGEAALRRIDIIAILNKLRVVKGVFPHGDGTTLPNMEMIYDDVLELSRPGLYGFNFRRQALQMLLAQIGSRQTRHLLLYLVKWPAVEISLFLSEVMACMPSDWLPPDTPATNMHRKLLNTYISSQRQDPPEDHTASPLLDFIVELAQVNDAACEAVLDSGFLDMLLCMYTCGFTDNMISPSARSRTDELEIDKARDTILLNCSAALLALCRHPDFVAVISTHPVSVLWPKNRRLLSIFGCRRTERYEVWSQLGPVMATRRLQSLSLSRLPTTMETDSDMDQVADAWVDLVQFSRGSSYDTQITQCALELMRQYGYLLTLVSDAQRT